MATFPLAEKQVNWYRRIAENNGSGYIGVNWCELAKKWRGTITNKCEHLHIGLFNKAIDAAVARDNKAIELWGGNAVTNYRLGLIKNTDDTGIKMNIKQDTTATKEKTYSLDSKTPEELAKMAEELLALSEAKKKEIANADTIRKRLNPLILNCFQAKGKVERALNELLDVTTDLDNALNALRDAMK